MPKMSPAFSPDGTRIAYTVVDREFHWDTWVVVRRNLVQQSVRSRVTSRNVSVFLPARGDPKDEDG
jgi:hypothetical protein